MIDIDKLDYERKIIKQGYTKIGGIDEAGRGPLAGPVVAACAIMDLSSIIEGVDDSKKLSHKKRAILLEMIKKSAVSYGVGIVDIEVIEKINILNATKLAMVEAYEHMDIKPEYVLCDAVKDLNIPVRQEAIIKGDSLSYSIGAASIIAKETRDDIMIQYDKIYPEYGFAQHKGYGTKQHIAALKKYGPCEIHRKSFLKKILGDAYE
ncbi:MAG: ribonuclease HII [Clostridia bacterium]|nr:ribonuclease HII [Clostridia bacterium]